MIGPRNVAIALAIGLGAAVGRAGESFTRGDCNADGSIVRGTLCEIADAIFLLAYLFADGREPPCREACNANADGRLDIADAVYLLSYCFSGGPPPPAPFPGCGEAAGRECARFGWCPGGCDPQDARGVGPCDRFLGFVWDGKGCGEISGCSCEGADCGGIFPTLPACEAAYGGCP